MGKVFVPPKLILAAAIVPTSPPVTFMVPVTLTQPLMSRGALLLSLDANDTPRRLLEPAGVAVELDDGDADPVPFPDAAESAVAELEAFGSVPLPDAVVSVVVELVAFGSVPLPDAVGSVVVELVAFGSVPLPDAVGSVVVELVAFGSVPLPDAVGPVVVELVAFGSVPLLDAVGPVEVELVPLESVPLLDAGPVELDAFGELNCKSTTPDKSAWMKTEAWARFGPMVMPKSNYVNHKMFSSQGWSHTIVVVRTRGMICAVITPDTSTVGGDAESVNAVILELISFKVHISPEIQAYH